MSEFRVEHTERDGAAGLVVTGELDVATAPQLEAELRASLASPGGDLVWTCARSRSSTPRACAVLVGAREAAAAEQGLRVAVRHGGQVERVFGLAGVADRLDLVRDGDTAADRGS